jgi:deoxyribodipyrimidine photo-lyase
MAAHIPSSPPIAINDFYLSSYPVKKYHRYFYQWEGRPIPSLASLGFGPTGRSFPPATINRDLLKKYKEQRDYPGIHGTSHLGLHLRFGTISIRTLTRTAATLSDTYLNELIWRDFYQMILWHFPKVGKGQAFKAAYDHIKWRNNEKEFEKWCAGNTGYPIVDAGMRELNTTGFMHNRVRMVVASFLAKHLLIDWRWGEAYFAEKLLDFDLAANNGGWQWAAGSGCDAAPYFRVFNPTLQTKKFDPDGTYVRRWVPEWEELNYPPPMVEHEIARKRALEAYSKAVKEQ